MEKLQYKETCRSLVEQLPKTLKLYTYCWKLQRDFYDFCDTTLIGMKPYSFEDYENFNKKLINYNKKLKENPRLIKAQIISMLDPLTI